MIAIVGGGISGLALGWELSRRGIPFQLFEASSEPGGVIRSARVEDHVLDWGPQRIRMTRKLESMIQDLGLQDQVITAPGDLGLQVYHSGRLREIPFDPWGFFTTDALSVGGKLRLLAEPLFSGADPAESVGRYFRRKLGREVYEHIVGPLYGGLYSSDPEDMVVGLSLGHVLKEFGIGRSLVWRLLRSRARIPRPPAVSFADGMAVLPRALARSLGRRVHLETPVEGLERRGAGWRIRLPGGAFDAAQVVVACPAPVAARMLQGEDPELAARLGALRYNPIAVVHVESSADLHGLGFKVSFSEDTALRGVTYNHAIFQRTGLYTVYLGGASHPSVVDLPDEDIADLAIREFHRTTGHPARTLSVGRERMPAWDASWATLEKVNPPEGVHFLANWRSRPGVPGRLLQAGRVASQLENQSVRPPVTRTRESAA